MAESPFMIRSRIPTLTSYNFFHPIKNLLLSQSGLVFFYNNTSVMSAKTKRIAQCSPYCFLLWFPEREVKPGVQFRVVGYVVDRRRYLIMNHAHHTGDGFYYAGGAKAVAGHGIVGANIHVVSVLPENIHDGFDLGPVTQGGRCTMGVYIIDIAGFHPRITKGCYHHIFGAQSLRVGGRHMISVCRSPTADDLTIDLSAPGPGMFQLFEYEHPGCFAHDKTVSVLVVGAAGCLIVVISFAQRLHGIEPAHAGLTHDSFGTAADNDIGHSKANEIKRFHDGIRRTGAGTCHCKIRAAEPVSHGNMTGRNVQDHFRNEKRVKAGSAVTLGEIYHLFLESDQSPDAAGKNDANAIGVHFFFIDACILYCLVAGRQRDLCITVYFTGLFFFQVLQGVKAFQFASKTSLKLCSIKQGNRISTGNAIHQSSPVVFCIVTYGSEGANARYDNSFQLHRGLFPGVMLELCLGEISPIPANG